MRGDGLYRRGGVWWMTWRTPDGKRHRASTEKHYHQEAKAVRDRLAGDVASHRPVTPPGKVTLATLCELIRTDYRVRGRRSGGTLETDLKRLTEYFGHHKAASISWGEAQKYREWAQGQGYAEATIAKRLAALKRMLRLAVKDGKLGAAPLIEIPQPKNARTGFFEREDFDTMVELLPPTYRGVARFAYLTGWRIRSEVLPLKWSNLDLAAGVVRLEPNTTKNDEGRTFPFDVLPALAELVRGQHDQAQGPWVFHDEGRSIVYRDFLDAWHAACEAAECRDRIPHDLQCTAVRNLERAGVSRSVAMKLTGQKTENVYRRYAIVAE